MWLNRFAGSGKLVLCSTAIQFALRHRRSDPKVGIAFFYFTFNDESKQDVSAMLRALLLQLSSQLRDGHADLTRLYESYKTGTPPSPVLIEHLQRLIQRFHQVYIVLNALDESPRNGPREYVLDALEAMRKWGVQGLHLFVTSRDEPDIRDSLDISATQQVTMQNAEIDKDIADFISGRFDADRRLRKLLPYRDKIQETLAKRAKGVYVNNDDDVLDWMYHAKGQRKGEGPQDLDDFWTKDLGFNRTQAVVLDLVTQEGIARDFFHILWLDNLFSSGRLFSQLYDQEVRI